MGVFGAMETFEQVVGEAQLSAPSAWDDAWTKRPHRFVPGSVFMKT
jgi:hypothetical protein